jgi:hypothetical protein
VGSFVLPTAGLLVRQIPLGDLRMRRATITALVVIDPVTVIVGTRPPAVDRIFALNSGYQF